jgi:hypothetical protein
VVEFWEEKKKGVVVTDNGELFLLRHHRFDQSTDCLTLGLV